MKIDGTNLSMIRGDSEGIILTIKENDVEYEFQEGDVVYFTIKKHANTDEIELQKIITSFEGNEAAIEIEPQDTKGLEFRSYVYDIQLTSGERVTTVVPHSNFIIEKEVTYD